jgi:hypothetical protein
LAILQALKKKGTNALQIILKDGRYGRSPSQMRLARSHGAILRRDDKKAQRELKASRN